MTKNWKQQTTATLKKLMVVSGKVTAEERKAGIVAKQLKLFLPKGFWVCLVEVEKLKVDKYQRILDKKHAANIRKEFNAVYVNMPICTCRNDSNPTGEMQVYVDDGAHTCDAIKECEAYAIIENGIKVIQCLVSFEMDKQAAAMLFSVKNSSSKKVGKWDTFRAAWPKIGSDESEIMRMACEFELTTPLTQPDLDLKKCDLKFAAEYLKIYRKIGKAFLLDLLKLHSKTFKGQYHTIQFLRGLVGYIRSCNIRPIEMLPYLKDKEVVGKIMAMATEIAAEGQKSRADASQVATAIGKLVRRIGIRKPLRKAA